MATSTVAAHSTDSSAVPSLDREEVLEVLSNRRRRYALHYLKWYGKETELRDLAEHVAAWENETTVDQLTYTDRKRVQNALHQFHLPKMDDRGFVEYDSRRGVVTLSPQTAETDFYVDVLPTRDVPWGLYYLSLSGISILVFTATALQVPPFSFVSPLSWCLLLVVVLSVSSIGHFYDNYYRMRLGARERPPELGR